MDAFRLSDIVSDIYECALDPGKWPSTMESIAAELSCFASLIYTVDFERHSVKVVNECGHGSYWSERFLDWTEFILQLNRPLLSAAVPLDEPLVMSRFIGLEVVEGMPIHVKWGRPQGFIDSLQTVVLREPGRIGIFGASRHESVGVAGDDEVSNLRLLAPHIRRAITIGDLLKHRAVAMNTMCASFDVISIGIVITDADCRIIHVNAAGERMLRERSPISRIEGKLQSSLPAATAELTRAISLCNGKHSIGAAGIGIPLTVGSEASIAHVLPIAGVKLGKDVMSPGVAAVFIAKSESRAPSSVEAVAKAFALTPTEARMLLQLAEGHTLNEAAEAMQIAYSTARTHMLGIFSKTGVNRQSELIALVNRLLPPVRMSEDG